MKLTKGQLASFLILARVFTLMTFVPLAEKEFSSLDIMLAIAVSTLIQILLAIPLFVISDRFPNENLFTALTNKSTLLGKITSFIYMLFFLLAAVNSLLGFKNFLNSMFGEKYGIWGMILLLLVCVYGLFSGISALGRFGGIVMGIFIVMIASIALFSAKDIELLNFSPFVSGSANTMVKAVISDISRNSEIILFTLLMGKVKEKAKSGFLSYLASKTIILEIAIFLITAVLGSYSKITEYPFFTLGGYTGIHAVERLDAVYLVVWTLTAILTVSLYLVAAEELFAAIIPKFRFTKISISVITLAAAVICSRLPIINGVFEFTENIVTITVLFSVIPLIAVFIMRCKNEGSK